MEDQVGESTAEVDYTRLGRVPISDHLHTRAVRRIRSLSEVSLEELRVIRYLSVSR